jgi:hypothetical protein
MKGTGYPEGYPAFVRNMDVRLIFAGDNAIVLEEPPEKKE